MTCGWGLAGAAALWWWFADSPVDRLFVGVLVLVLATAATIGSVLRPRLLADSRGLTVRSLRGSRHWPWADVTVRIARGQRLGRTVESLELDTAEGELVVLGRTELGADPRDVADALDELRG
ncbi:hypothetical protein GCM10027563_20570 [Parasphingorhabdus pacifica]